MRTFVAACGLAVAVLIASAALAADAPSTAPASSPSDAVKTWTVDAEHFSLRTPASWLKRPVQQPAVVLLLRQRETDTSHGLAKVLTVSVAPQGTLERIASLDAEIAGVKRVVLKHHPDAKFDDVKDITIDGLDAKMFGFAHTLDGKAAKSLRALVIKDHKVYLLGLIAEEKSADASAKIFGDILGSFRWLKS